MNVRQCLCLRRLAATSVSRSFAAKAKRKGKKVVGFPVHTVIDLVQKNARSTFDETVELVVSLGVDPRKPGQNIRGFASLPNGTGKTQRVAVFATKPEHIEAAKAAGADLVGLESILDDVQKGIIDFERCVAAPDCVGKLGKVARILGPRGLMPNPKLGTVTTDIAQKVKEMKAGQVQYRTEKNGIIHAGVGKVSFTHEQIAENVESLLTTISQAKPEDFSGSYFKAVHMSSTMGSGYQVTIASADPSAPGFMKLTEEEEREVEARQSDSAFEK